jgi:hypothetical protein
VKEREARLEVFVQPVIERWQSPQLAESLSTFGGFCDMLGLSNLQSYLVSRRVNTIEDWAQFPLDEEGKTLNAAIEAAQNVSSASISERQTSNKSRMCPCVSRRHFWG